MRTVFCIEKQFGVVHVMLVSVSVKKKRQEKTGKKERKNQGTDEFINKQQEVHGAQAHLS